MLANLGGWHLLIILGIVVLLFGATRLPALARSIGQSARIFKQETRDSSAESEPSAPAPAAD
jgi:sec-independent protein translocase protein TatA